MEPHSHHPRTYGRRTALQHTYDVRTAGKAVLAGSVERNALNKAAKHAIKALGLRRGPGTLLRALAACYGEQKLTNGILVWPSNRYLCENAIMCERTVRSAILELRQLGLLIAVDSSNGKRFARRRRDDDKIVSAYGFDLSPLYARRFEFSAAVEIAETEENLIRELRVDVNSIRREIIDILTALARLGRADLIECIKPDLDALVIPRSARLSSAELTDLLTQASALHARAERAHFEASLHEEITGNDGKNCRHIESNEECSSEGDQKRSGDKSPQHSNSSGAYGANIWAFEEEGGKAVRSTEHVEELDSEESRSIRDPAGQQIPRILLDPALWRGSCPALSDWHPEPFRSIENVAASGREAASYGLGVSKAGLDAARTQLGPILFPLVAAYVYQICQDDEATLQPKIRNHGGLFMAVAREVADGVRDLSLELMALRRKRRARS